MRCLLPALLPMLLALSLPAIHAQDDIGLKEKQALLSIADSIKPVRGASVGRIFWPGNGWRATADVPCKRTPQGTLSWKFIACNKTSNRVTSILIPRTAVAPGAFLTGTLPWATMTDLAELALVSINKQNISGDAFPPELAQFSHLKTLSLESNNLVGLQTSGATLPASLQLLNLQGNPLKGVLSNFPTGPTELSSISLANTQLSGSFPTASLEGFKKLRVLILANNSCNGTIPAALWSLQNATIDLSSNFFTGEMPANVSTRVRLGNNCFVNSMANSSVVETAPGQRTNTSCAAALSALPPPSPSPPSQSPSPAASPSPAPGAQAPGTAAPSPPPPSSSSSSMGLIIGLSVAGGILILALIGLLIWLLMPRKNSEDYYEEDEEEEDEEEDDDDDEKGNQRRRNDDDDDDDRDGDEDDEEDDSDHDRRDQKGGKY